MSILWPTREAASSPDPDADKRIKAAAAAAADVLAERNGLERDTLRLVAKHLDDLQRELSRKLAGDLTDFRRHVLSELLRDAERLIDQTRRQLEAVASSAINQADELGDHYATAPIRAAGVEVATGLPGIDQTLVVATIQNTASLLTETMRPFTDLVRQQVRAVTLAGDGQIQAIQRLQRAIEREGIPGAAYRAERIIRTEVGRVFNDATHQRLENLASTFPFLRKGWQATGDDRTRLGHVQAAVRYARGQGIPIADRFELAVYDERDKAAPRLLGTARLRYPIDPKAEPAGRLAAAATIMCRCNAFVDFNPAELAAFNRQRLSTALAGNKPPLPEPRLVARIRFVPAGEGVVTFKRDTFSARVEFPVSTRWPSGGFRSINGYRTYEDAVAKLTAMYPGILIIDETEGRRPAPPKRAAKPKPPKPAPPTPLLPPEPGPVLEREGPKVRGELLEKAKAVEALAAARDATGAELAKLASAIHEIERKIAEKIDAEWEAQGRETFYKNAEGFWRRSPAFKAELARRGSLDPAWVKLKGQRDGIQSKLLAMQEADDNGAGLRRFIDQRLTQKGPDGRLTLNVTYAPNLAPDVRAGVEAGAAVLERWVKVADKAGATRALKAIPSQVFRSSYTPGFGIINMGTARVEIAVHEIAHFLEEAIPGWHDRAVAFLIRRTEGYAAKPLSALVPGSNYAAWEIASEDKFRSPYTGKWYVTGAGPFKDWPDVLRRLYATEVVSMGLEALYTDPLALAKTDPDLFDFVVDLVTGTAPAAEAPKITGHVPQRMKAK